MDNNFIWKYCERCKDTKADYSINVGNKCIWWLCMECYTEANNLIASFIDDFNLEGHLPGGVV